MTYRQVRIVNSFLSLLSDPNDQPLHGWMFDVLAVDEMPASCIWVPPSPSELAHAPPVVARSKDWVIPFKEHVYIRAIRRIGENEYGREVWLRFTNPMDEKTPRRIRRIPVL